MENKARKRDIIRTNGREDRNFSLKKDSFDFEWVVDSTPDRKRKGKPVNGVESSRKKSKFDFDEGFVMLSSESASVSDDECRPRWKEVISPSSVKPGSPKRGCGRQRRNERGVSERIMKSDEDVIVINCDENDDVNNFGENDIDTSAFGESGVMREPRTGGSENSVVRKKSVSVGVQVEDDQNLVIKKYVSVGVQMGEDDRRFLDYGGNSSGIAASEGHFRNESSDHDLKRPCLENDGRTAHCDGAIGPNIDGVTTVPEEHFYRNESGDIGSISPCLENFGGMGLCDGLKSSAGGNDIGENASRVTAASEGHFHQNESGDHGLARPCLKNDGKMGQCDLLKFDVGGNAIGADVGAKPSNSNIFNDVEGGVMSEDDALDLRGDLEYVGETFGSYINMDEVSPCKSEDEDRKFCQASSVKDEDCSEQNTANLNCLARRTRSHFTKVVDRKSGTFSCPLCLSDDDDVSLVDSSIDDGHHRNKKCSRKNSKTNQKRHNQRRRSRRWQRRHR